MDINRILSELDAEIARLHGIRAALTGLNGPSSATTKGRRGRPRGSKNNTKSVAPAAAKAITAKAVAAAPVAAKAAKKAAKRKLSPEGRKRIADAMKKRWAERRKQAAK
jgi:hypothetical protein